MTDAPTPAAEDTPDRPRTAPKLPDQATADVDDWEQFQQVYAGWVERATDDELLAEMAALPVDGRPLSPAEAWMYHQCELRRRRPTNQRAAAGRKRG
ncbi:hypothetical protein [Micromonospora eburnea]|uniref:Uncharacterized protein n=1 Tax=Micromonospora eburnea TaxID=227316 RepID=A0A1C6TQN1_9ACTN|nr:hypothetical protein [Micromonospora eburnea]SCL43820.1 hypothetical protein GA0070604_0026 [Micromonospora eburnea]SCL43993.1 hypothetical protein GA0070604_0132 [Micromonospora eburnea]